MTQSGNCGDLPYYFDEIWMERLQKAKEQRMTYKAVRLGTEH